MPNYFPLTDQSRQRFCKVVRLFLYSLIYASMAYPKLLTQTWLIILMTVPLSLNIEIRLFHLYLETFRFNWCEEWRFKLTVKKFMPFIFFKNTFHSNVSVLGGLGHFERKVI